jgi:predicted polyphosphate/ATP-dependent NAD kinase
MKITRLLGVLLLALTAAGAAACASGGGGGTAHDVTIEIDNNLPMIAGVSAYLVTSTGGRRSLGPVESNRTATFQRNLRTGDYQLLATRVGVPEDIISERFRVDTAAVVSWNMSANQITIRTR